MVARSDHTRIALASAAAALVYEQGVRATTLADVASRAAVPLGNVYYYFKTKDALAEAVIALHALRMREHFAKLERDLTTPRERLRVFVRTPLANAADVMMHGCPYGSLCQELAKLGATDTLARASAKLLVLHVDWVERQLRAHGITRGARGLSEDLVASLQGLMLLAHAQKDEALFTAQTRRLERSLFRMLTTKGTLS